MDRDLESCQLIAADKSKSLTHRKMMSDWFIWEYFQIGGLTL